MSLKALQTVWSSQLPLLNDRVKSGWFSQLTHIQEATSEDIVHDASLLAKGFVVALLEAGLIDESGAHLLGTTLLSIQSEAVARLDHNQRTLVH
ncbi:hypothetical protein PsaNZ64_00320 [Pseudomonas syringae pv. actinidiae]|uniref:hypothetical protein n=1 Tax=Pseudomonas syringae group TaxID=136849 RepID=UPI0006B901D5|nr:MULTISPECIES: hypothetical protein [Pseudomonas syringae group]KPB36966.1 Uncharacterized protein AC516_4027 [Pseudomonas amygdali pv. sesami]OKS78760.1 hypothetical protein PsaNZ64_00320 [Pseudomonas syringae pv. actinidiae]